ncbi:MAG TPA: histone deacetylase [Verrucomicrobiota bacterium]|nr:histone deacetylase [Verrucomicrobiota bacterium]HNU49858.1 histone deacetylase [Verrucomicrobiota bacterium]
MTVITDPRCASYREPGHPERPERVSRTLELLKSQTALPITWATPLEPEESQILRVHDPLFLDRLSLPMDFDTDTPAHPDIRSHAERSVGGALSALKAALDNDAALSLMRPPGHHATADRAMGFCYLNSVAIAALEALSSGHRPVAVYDFDVHHGNGTEDIFLGRDDCAYFSVHQYPAYPGTGRYSSDNAHNYPVRPGASRDEYRSALRQALDDLKAFRPALVAVSAGFDAYRGDPLSDASLEEEDYHWLGAELRRLGVPCFGVLEGGYSDELPNLILAYLRGAAG